MDTPRFITRKLNAQTDISGPLLITIDTAALEQNLGTFVQRGLYTLAANVAFVTLPRALISAASAANIVFSITSYTTNPQYLTSIAKASALGSALISSVSGFSVSGSGTDMGSWLAMGYK